jgi:hypothetical protein
MVIFQSNVSARHMQDKVDKKSSPCNYKFWFFDKTHVEVGYWEFFVDFFL